jgi:(1->4)-alpha-D-glucan 1-alpha-D-glucosylmutase
VQAFHGASQDRAAHWPHTMLATSTHDNKRSEDVRTRIDVLSEMPAAWRLALRRWRQLNRRHRTDVEGASAPSPNDEYLLYQTLLGAWPLDPLDEDALRALRERIQAYMLKAVREAKVHTSWVNNHPEYEAALARFIDGLLGTLTANRFLDEFVPAQRRIARHGCVNSLAQTLVKLTSPGVPDTYQGTELWDLSLVDPDNRRPVDYALRARYLEQVTAARDDPAGYAVDLLESWPDGRIKLWLTARLLRLRRERAGFFERAGYAPVRVDGTAARHVCAYARGVGDAMLVTVVPRLWMALTGDSDAWPVGGAAWGDTTLRIRGTRILWRSVLTAETVAARATAQEARIALGDALKMLPFALLEPTTQAEVERNE